MKTSFRNKDEFHFWEDGLEVLFSSLPTKYNKNHPDAVYKTNMKKLRTAERKTQARNLRTEEWRMASFLGFPWTSHVPGLMLKSLQPEHTKHGEDKAQPKPAVSPRDQERGGPARPKTLGPWSLYSSQTPQKTCGPTATPRQQRASEGPARPPARLQWGVRSDPPRGGATKVDWRLGLATTLGDDEPHSRPAVSVSIEQGAWTSPRRLAPPEVSAWIRAFATTQRCRWKPCGSLEITQERTSEHGDRTGGVT